MAVDYKKSKEFIKLMKDGYLAFTSFGDTRKADICLEELKDAGFDTSELLKDKK